ncbi:MAG: hypothetical protein KC646_10975 [Candidatus Cloacimonetes bacterium]|nr:hypothetical protein [Candidatus Cloacimonadota bacterium]
MHLFFLLLTHLLSANLFALHFDPPIHSLRTSLTSASFSSNLVQQSSHLIYTNDFRNVFNGTIGDIFDFQLHLNHHYQQSNKSIPLRPSISPFEQFSHQIYNKDDFLSKIDRLQLSFQSKGLDYVVGRQAISFGTSHFISAMDVINPFAPGTIDSSFKPGIDALRIQKALSDTGEIEFIFAANQINKDNAYFLRSRVLKNNIDYEILVGRFRQHNMVALGFEGEVKSQSVWGEFSLINYDENLLDTIDQQSLNLALNLGLDFHPNIGETISLSWFHQEAGAKNPKDFHRVQSNPSFIEQFSYLRGRNYLNLSYQRKIKHLVDFASSVIYNTQDHSSYIQPKLHINTSDNSSLVLFYTLGIGKEATVGGINSDFGDLPHTVGLFSQIYF